MNRRIDFNKVTPESVGLDSKVILKELKKLDSIGVPMHSFLISRGRNLVLEAYYNPYDADTAQRIYSCTKSFVSLAIGILVTKGCIQLSDRIVDYFPEKCPEIIPNELMNLTIENMLKMSTCYSSTTYKQGRDSSYIKSFQKDWVGSFFNSQPTHCPGDIFLYDTSSTHTLCALVEKITGKDLLSFLRESFLLDIGCKGKMYAEKDPMGYTSGGSGLSITAMDFMRVMRFVADGCYGLIDSDYIKEATTKQIDTALTQGATSFHMSYGYGYQFWIMRDSSYAMYGMGGQFALYVVEKDLLFVSTADTQGFDGYNNYILDAMWAIADEAKDFALDENKRACSALEEYKSRLNLSALKQDEKEALPFIDNYKYTLEENANCIMGFILNAKNEEGSIRFDKNNQIIEIPFAFGRNVISNSPFEKDGYIASSASFSNGILNIAIKFLSRELGSMNITLGLNESGASLKIRLIGELSFTGYSGLYRAIRV